MSNFAKLMSHPSLQYPNNNEDSDFIYYINKKVEYNHAMTTFAALALAVEEFIQGKEK